MCVRNSKAIRAMMLKSIRYKRRRIGLHSCEHGTTLVEFAIIAPLLFLLIMATLEIGYMMIAKNALEIGATAASRYGSMGGTAAGSDRATSIQELIKSKSLGFIDPSKIVIDIRAYNQFSDINGTDPSKFGTPTSGTSGAGLAGQAVLYMVSYDYIPFTPVVAAIFGTKVTLKAISIARNEEVFK